MILARWIAANIAKLPKFCAKANSILSAVVVTAAAHTRLPLADGVSDGKADYEHDRKGNWIHDTSPGFRKHQTPTRQTSGTGVPETRKINGGGA